MAVSVLEIFKVGIGPSSSHTVGPMRAARMFTLALAEQGVMTSVTRVLSEMFGSLGATGKGHGTDSAVLLGLSGHEPDTVDVDQVPAILEGIRGSSSLLLQGAHRIALDEEANLMLSGLQTLAFHSNGMRFTAFDASGSTLLEKTYYSVGDAVSAVQKYKPNVVIGCWVTHVFDERRPDAGGNMFGIDEAKLIATCDEYIVVGTGPACVTSPMLIPPARRA